ncbi:hypothetical protein Tco_1266639 [Tanacetum coccineum]
MVINSPCLTDKKELGIPGQTMTGKEFSNPLLAGSLPKTISAKGVVILESSVKNDLLFDDEDGITYLTNDEIFENLALMGNLDSKKFLMYPRFLQLFLNNQLKDLPEPFNDTYETPSHTKKVFSNMARQSKSFSGKVTPLFESMLVQNQAPEGESSVTPPEPQPTPSTSQPNVSEPQTELLQTETPPTVSHEPQTEANIEQILPSPSIYQRKHRKTQKHRRAKKVTELPQTSVPLDLGADEVVHKEGVTALRNHGGAPAQTRSKRVLKQPNEPPLPEGGYTPGSDESRLKWEELMVMCTKLSKQVLDLEKEKDAQAVELLKLKKRVESSNDDLDEEGASKQGRTSKKTKPMFKDNDFDDLDDLVDEGMAFVQEKDAENQGKIGADDTEAVNTAGEGVSIAAPRTPPATTTLVFDDEDVTMAMAQTLIKMKEEKAKEKRVAIKDVEDSSKPIRSITTLQPLPTIDPKDKGKGILQKTKPVEKTKKKVQGDAQIERDVEIALRIQAELDKELKVEKQRQEEASKVAMADMFDKNMGGYKHSQLKRKSYEEIQGLYERQQKRIQDFTPMNSEKEAQKPGKRLKRVAGTYVTHKSSKKPKVMKSAKDVTEEEAAEYEQENEELRLSLKIISNDDSEVNYEPLSRKFPIGDLRMIFNPDEKDELSMNQLDWKLLRWKLYESCGVHTLFMDGKPMEINMLVEKKYPLIKELLEKMLNLQLEAELIKFIKSLLEE